ncbi:ribonuclease 3-like protein 3 [Pyrus x bretschneideri]|uniref:ribonuclease 3-like protein 3 n=1 Tax=Pyrus x bretschneideri TaxID=225117 RepID=UPI00202F27A6|nr:ribonuclease 3-like protein 3 [Pyrus x bretschneideri]
MEAVQATEEEIITTLRLDDVKSTLPFVNKSTSLTDHEHHLNLEEVEKIIGYKFENKVLLQEAFTHSSFVPAEWSGSSYERLEYVGDAVLNLIFSREQYLLYPDLAPGPLTRLRAANVDTEKLARVAVKHGLYRYLRHRKPLLEEQIRKFMRAISDYPLHSNGLIDAPKNLADIVESTIGAVFMDCKSIDIVWKVFKNLLEPIIDPKTIKKHPVSQLHEVCQKNNLKLRFVDLWEEKHTVEVFINDQIVGRGTYSLKKEVAQNRAAKDAFDNMWNVIGQEKDKVQDPQVDNGQLED